ncbi:hypothetical protein ACIREO_34820 [Streptomyces sp. NPDC102441]|uniref:hypothetical protein n=1 Tax=Streptomyces sp. NPDC102441 TaxID=3366176 RepID=UPI003813A77D
MTTPAHAAYGPCNTTSWRDVPTLGGENDFKIPARSGNGSSCYLSYYEGSSPAVKALQQAITICYPGTWASTRIHNSGGADGVYGTGMVAAVRWLRINKQYPVTLPDCPKATVDSQRIRRLRRGDGSAAKGLAGKAATGGNAGAVPHRP